MCIHRYGREWDTRAELERHERKRAAAKQVADKCVPAEPADQAIFQEIVKPVKQEQFVSAYLAKR